MNKILTKIRSLKLSKKSRVLSSVVMLSVLTTLGGVAAIVVRKPATAPATSSQSSATKAEPTIVETPAPNSEQPVAQTAPATATPQATNAPQPTAPKSTKPTASSSAPAKDTSTYTRPPMMVTKLTISGSHRCEYDDSGLSVVAESGPVAITVTTNHVDGSVVWHWEYDGDVENMNDLNRGTFTESMPDGYSQKTVSIGMVPSRLLARGTAQSFRYRAVSSSPNVVASNWVTVPAYYGYCR